MQRVSSPHSHPQLFAIRNKLYCAVLIGAVDIFLTYFLYQPFHYLLGGVAEGITLTYRDNG